MHRYQILVMDEKTKLDEKLAKLIAFINGPDFVQVPQAERRRIINQSGIMREYSEILGARIESFRT
ncbi:hypothetical protein BH20PSE1_BH20PSE1_01580 [soil metagenome]